MWKIAMIMPQETTASSPAIQTFTIARNAIAPTVAVRGNIDTGQWARALSPTEVVDVEDLHLYVLHDLTTLDLDAKAAGFSAVISGHTHRASAQTRDGVLYLNPGSAGPRRFKLAVTVGRLIVEAGEVRGEIVELG